MYGRYGYRRITALLNNENGWRVNHKRVERIWRREGLKVPKKQPKRSWLWLNDGSCIRLRTEHKDHVWSYDFVMDRTANGPEFTAKAIRKWLNRLGVKTLFIEPGSPWENGCVESFNGKMRDELLNLKLRGNKRHHYWGRVIISGAPIRPTSQSLHLGRVVSLS